MFACLYSKKEHFALAHWQIQELSLGELGRMNARLLTDARSRELYETEHIVGAIWLSEEAWDEALPAFLGAWQPAHPVVIYCGGQACAASKRVAMRLLKDLPEAKIYVLKGGFPEWQAAQR